MQKGKKFSPPQAQSRSKEEIKGELVSLKNHGAGAVGKAGGPQKKNLVKGAKNRVAVKQQNHNRRTEES